MRRFIPWALGVLCACDPAVGSLVECESAPASAMVDDTVPPVDAAELQAWLASRRYQEFLGESGAHASDAPHGGRVRTYVNGPLARSLGSCSESHPVGAASVKELHRDDAISGWAVMVKTRAEAGADSWYWYEVFDTAPAARPAFAGQAHGTCTGCHDGGLDAIRTAWPLR